MRATVKKVLKWAIFLWLAGIFITGLLIPRFQKKLPQLPAESLSSGESSVQERICCINDNQEALIRRLQLIESAEEDLVLSTYYLADDQSGRDIMSALLHAADRGVRVRVMTDGLSTFLALRNSQTFAALSEADNIEVKVYNPVNLLFPWRTNYRMHDKYLIADGRTYILGGRNTKDVSLGAYPGKHDNDRDMLVCSPETGGSAQTLTEYFESVWGLPEAKPPKGSSRPHPEGREMLESHYETLPQKYPEAFVPVDFQEITRPAERVTLLTNPPHAGNKVPTLLAALIDRMERGQDIAIETPYIICNHTMYKALSDLTDSGKSVQILTNSPDRGANPCGCADFLNHRWRLRKTGAEIWEYAGERSSHTKTILIDDTVSIVGSFNFDMRSTYLDTETMLVIESRELNQQLRELHSQSMRFSSSIQGGGEVLEGENYVKPPFSAAREMIYGLLRIVILPLRHLL